MGDVKEQLTVLSAGLIGRGLVTAEDADADGFDPVNVALTAIDAKAGEISALERSVASYKGQLTRAKNAAAALEGETPDKPRKFKPLADPLAPGDLLELLGDAKTVELAFLGSNGAELKGVAPRRIEGGANAWRLANGKLRLQVPSLLVHGRAHGEAPIVIGSYALLADGEHVATADRPEPLHVGAQSKFELAADVAFG